MLAKQDHAKLDKSCRQVILDLALCCKNNRPDDFESTRHCALSRDQMDACTELRVAYYHCKRQQADGRSRIRGPKGFQ